MNPLLCYDFHVPFDRMKPQHVIPAVRQAIARADSELEAIAGSKHAPTYSGTVAAFDDMTEKLERVMRFARHLMAVSDSLELRSAVHEVLPEYSAFSSRLLTHGGLWRAVQAYADSPGAATLGEVRRRRLEHLLRDFKLHGADLPEKDKAETERIRVRLAELHTKFAENVLDATNSYELIVGEEAALAGLPEGAKRRARDSARSAGHDGWRFTLHEPSYRPLLTYAERRDLRRELYQAFTHRASEGRLDNRPLIRDILRLRRRLARLLGFDNYADYALALNMVKTAGAAEAFVQRLYEATKPHFDRDVAMLSKFAREALGLDPLEPWDVLYAIEKMRRANFDIDQEALRPYFPVDRVLSGMFAIARRLFGIEVTEKGAIGAWHPDVRRFDVHDSDGILTGSFYADLYPRQSKRSGAWKNGLIVGGPRAEGFEPHLAVIAANFTPPDSGSEALLTHDEVVTTFHEFGHLLHHLLSRVDVRALGGTQVPRDFVELPSQIMENWTFEREALDLFARHAVTDEPLPPELYEGMRRSRTFMEAYKQMRQLSFAKVDLDLHIHFDPESDEDVIAFAQRAMEPFQIRAEFAHNSFVTSFTHVFTGGYAAGYYSYKWSEVLDADAFTRFAREGILNRETGRAFAEAILSKGDSVDPLVQFKDFMGRDPDLQALIRRNLDPAGAAEAGR